MEQVELLSCIDDATPSRERVQRFGLSLDCDLIKKAPQHCLRWLRAVCPSQVYFPPFNHILFEVYFDSPHIVFAQIYLDRALGKQFGIPEGARMACALAMWRTEWRPTLQAARTPVTPPAAASSKQAHLPLPSESESDGAQLFKQLVLIEQFDLLKFLGTDPKTCMWIGLSILFHQNAAALALYRMFFLELSIELQMVARSLQRLSWPQQVLLCIFLLIYGMCWSDLGHFFVCDLGCVVLCLLVAPYESAAAETQIGREKEEEQIL
jgi:hypothetical protein